MTTPLTVVIFGASGDDAFRDKMKEAVSSHKEQWDAAVWDRFAKQLYYVAADITGEGGPAPLQAWFDANEGPNGGRRLYYFSVKPELYPDLSAALGDAGFAKEAGGF